jgi:hypothetical protein
MAATGPVRCAGWRFRNRVGAHGSYGFRPGRSAHGAVLEAQLLRGGGLQGGGGRGFGEVLGAFSTKRARNSSVRRIRHGAPRRDLFAGDEAIVEPTMKGRWRDAERLRRAFYRHALSLAYRLPWFEARDVPVRTQAAHAIGRPVAVLRRWRLRIPAR